MSGTRNWRRRVSEAKQSTGGRVSLKVSAFINLINIIVTVRPMSQTMWWSRKDAGVPLNIHTLYEGKFILILRFRVKLVLMRRRKKKNEKMKKEKMKRKKKEKKKREKKREDFQHSTSCI